MIAERMGWWHVPQRSASLGRKLVVKGATAGFFCVPCMLWQLAHVTSFLACLPDSQNARWRPPLWQVMQTAVRSDAGAG